MREDERWEEVSEILDRAFDLEPAERPRFLDKTCGTDGVLRRRLERLLATDEQSGDFLSRPIFSLHGNEEDRIGPYRLVRSLGRGGMGAVYLAERDDGEFKQTVALKLLRPGFDSEEVLNRFGAERQILAQLTHDNVSRLLDGGTDRGRPYFVMEHVDGQPIDDYCDEQRLNVGKRVELFRSVCEAVHFAHRNLVVHRDLKPGNILVTASGRVKLLDFGIAKLLRNDPALPHAQLVHTGTLVPAPMTPYYASPEQVRGELVTTASDVYSLGVVLYELLTGHRPLHFETLTPQDVARAVCEEMPRRPSTVVKEAWEVREADGTTRQVAPESISEHRDTDTKRLRRALRGDLDNIVMTALRKEPSRRFSSVENLSEDLRRYLERLPVRSRADTLGYRSAKFVQRNAQSLVAAAAIVFLALGLTTMTVASKGQKARIGRLDAELGREQKLSGSVTTFLVNVLKSTDSSRTGGRTLTVREAFDAAATHLGTELNDAPEVEATLADAIGGVYRDLEFYNEARPFLEEALALRREALGEEHPLVAESLHNLATLERHFDKERADELMREALEKQRRVYPNGHPDLARGLNNFAAYVRREGRLEEAEELAREALAMKLQLFGGEDPEVASTLNTLASIRRDQNDFGEAEKLFRRTVDIRRKAEPDSKNLATVLDNLADLLGRKNRLDEALPLHQEALRIRRQLYPEGHRYVVQSLHNTGYLQVLRGQHEEAGRLFAEALTMSERLPGRPLWDDVKGKQTSLKQMTPNADETAPPELRAPEG